VVNRYKIKPDITSAAIYNELHCSDIELLLQYDADILALDG